MAKVHSDAPTAYGAIPTPAQVSWHRMEFTGFLHFTVNTFTDKEWGYGDEPESVFNPTNFSADQIVSVAKKAGMKLLILTAKHHDGFCLWPTKTTTHNVSKSPFKKDVVKLISDACQKQGLKFGVYLSPWDRNNALYGKPEYIEIYRQQLRELLTNYGPISEVWHDGANGGDGYYGGARETRKIDASTYYDWPNTWKLVRELAPRAVIFSDVGPDVRWVGNEGGYAADPSWSTFTPRPIRPGTQPAPGLIDTVNSGTGDRNGKYWMPAECDVSIRPGWFWHADQNSEVKSPEALKELYFRSVGQGAVLLLNIPPDRTGRIHSLDEKALLGFRKLIDDAFKTDLARTAKATASDVRGTYVAQNVVDGKIDTYWATKDATRKPTLTLTFPKPVEFNTIRLREPIALGHRIDSVLIEAEIDNRFEQIATATSIGNCRLIQIEPVRTTRLRLRVQSDFTNPCLSEVGLFLDPNEAP